MGCLLRQYLYAGGDMESVIMALLEVVDTFHLLFLTKVWQYRNSIVCATTSMRSNHELHEVVEWRRLSLRQWQMTSLSRKHRLSQPWRRKYWRRSQKVSSREDDIGVKDLSWFRLGSASGSFVLCPADVWLCMCVVAKWQHLKFYWSCCSRYLQLLNKEMQEQYSREFAQS